MVDLLTDIEQLDVEPDEVARVVIDEANGIIVMGENVRISTVAVAQGNLTVRVTETPQVSQPNPFSAAGTTAPTVGANGAPQVPDPRRRPVRALGRRADRRRAAHQRPGRRAAGAPHGVLHAGVSLQELVNGLNALGVGPRDMISILQAIKAAGALQADIELM